jgi:hypothetical protein
MHRWRVRAWSAGTARGGLSGKALSIAGDFILGLIVSTPIRLARSRNGRYLRIRRNPRGRREEHEREPNKFFRVPVESRRLGHAETKIGGRHLESGDSGRTLEVESGGWQIRARW